MVATKVVSKESAGVALSAAPADAGQASRSLLTVQLKHDCLATACSDASCPLCANSTLRACTSDLKQKYVAGSAVQAPCGAWPVLELICSQPEALNSAKYNVKVDLIDVVKYQELGLAGVAPPFEQLTSCLATDAGLRYKKTESPTVILPVVDGQADLKDLYIYKVPGNRSGHSTFYRLLITVHYTAHKANSTKAVSAAVAAPTAAPLLTDKLQLVTTRSRCNEKCDVLQADLPVKRVQAVGEGFAKILSELKEYVAEVPADLASVTKVGHFHQLVLWVKETDNTAVPNLFRPNDWTRASQHVLSALSEDDNRQRLWFPSVSGAGLLFKCQQGDVQLDSPEAFVLMLGESLAVRPLSQLGVAQLQELVLKAKADWCAVGHSNWSIHGVDEAGHVGAEAAAKRKPGTGESQGAGTAAAANPAAVLARAAIASAFGAVCSKLVGVRKSTLKPAAATAAPAALGTAGPTVQPAVGSSSPVAATAVLAAITATFPASPGPAASVTTTAITTADASPYSSASATSIEAVPPLSLADVDLAPAAVSVDGALAGTAAAVHAVPDTETLGPGHKRQRSELPVEAETPAKRACSELQLGFASASPATATEMGICMVPIGVATQASPAAAVVFEEAAVMALDPGTHNMQSVDSSKQQCQQQQSTQEHKLQQQQYGSDDAEDDEFWQLGALVCSSAASGDWSNDLGDLAATPDLDADLADTLGSLGDSFLAEMQQQDAEKQQQGDFEGHNDDSLLQQLYKSMSDDWCSGMDAELGNNLGSTLLAELQHSVGQSTGAVGPAAVDEGLLARLVSLSDLPDFAELCDESVQGLNAGLQQLPLMLV